MIPTYATTFEARAINISEEYIYFLWFHKRGKQREERRRESDNLPPGFDMLFRGIFAGMDQQLELKDEKSILKAYVDERDEYTSFNLFDVIGFIKYFDYEDLLAYLAFFTTNPIKETLAYGSMLAKRVGKTPGKRMDGKLLPRYPSVVKVEWMRKPKVTPIRKPDSEEEK
jgi:hypothetical protein